jgi:hypothetical protein
MLLTLRRGMGWPCSSPGAAARRRTIRYTGAKATISPCYSCSRVALYSGGHVVYEPAKHCAHGMSYLA